MSRKRPSGALMNSLNIAAFCGQPESESHLLRHLKLAWSAGFRRAVRICNVFDRSSKPPFQFLTRGADFLTSLFQRKLRKRRVRYGVNANGHQ